jgi:hypothetical protein
VSLGCCRALVERHPLLDAKGGRGTGTHALLISSNLHARTSSKKKKKKRRKKKRRRKRRRKKKKNGPLGPSILPLRGGGEAILTGAIIPALMHRIPSELRS